MHKNLYHLTLIFVIFSNLLLANEEDDEDTFIVPLATGIHLTPIYISPFKALDTSLKEENVEELESVLAFDLNASGFARVEKSQHQKPNYQINITINKNKIHTQILSKLENWTKEIGALSLSGDRTQDRLQMHLISDKIQKLLFGQEGIARSKILYTIRKEIPGKKDWTSEIWQVDYDGANPKQILSDAGYCVTPQYLPPMSGKKAGHFFYVSYITGQPKIFIASLKESEPRRFSLLKGNQLMPTLSMQRNKVAFICDITGNPDLFILDFSPEKGPLGKPRQIFSAKQSAQGTPTFSPDGKKIAFVSNKDGSPRIYMMNIPEEGAKLKDIRPTLITKYRRGCTAPAWSPDGQKIAYCANMNGVRQIFVYNLKLNEEIQLTQGTMNKENPSWASDSLHLVYNASNNNKSELYIVNLNQITPIKITSGSGEKRFPSWEPTL